MLEEDNQTQDAGVDSQEGIAMPTAESLAPQADMSGWIQMSPEEMVLAQEQGILMGFDPAKGLGLVKAVLTKEKKKK